jgi:hypothetical protein
VRVVGEIERGANLTVLRCFGLPVASSAYTFTAVRDREPVPDTRDELAPKRP